MIKRKLTLFLLFALFLTSADAIVRKEVRTFKKQDNGYTMEYLRTMKRLGEFARNYWADPRILLEEGQIFKLQKAYTVNSRGKKIEVTPEAIHKLTPAGLQRYPYFSFLQEKTINFLGIDLPSESTLSYTLTVKDEPIDEVFYLEEPALSKEKTWKFLGFDRVFFDSPGETPEINNIEIASEKGIQIRFKNLPPYPPEPHQPRPGILIVSTRTGWKELGEMIFNIFSQEEGLSKESLSLIDGNDAFSILENVRNAIEKVTIPMKYSIFKARSGEEAFRSRYASPAELALILMDVYSAKGYKALPFLLAGAERFSEKVPAVSQFDDAGIYLTDLGLYITSDLKPKRTFHNKIAWVILPSPHFVRFPKIEPSKNKVNIIVNITDQKIEGEISTEGNFILSGEAKAQAGKWLQRAGLRTKIKEAKILGQKLTFSGEIELQENTIKLHPDLLLLPQEPETFALPRITPIDIGEPFKVNMKINLTTSGNIIYSPTSFSLTKPMGNFVLRSQKQGENSFSLEYKIAIKKGVIQPEEAENLKEIWAAARDKSTTYIIYLSK